MKPEVASGEFLKEHLAGKFRLLTMKMYQEACIFACTAAAALAWTAFAAPVNQTEKKIEPSAARQPVPLHFDRDIPLSTQSAGIEWNNETYHLVKLNSIRFALNRRTSELSAEIKGLVTDFDDVTYDLSVALFDASGELLGATRAECNLERIWASRPAISSRTFNLNFGVSVGYERAASFMLAISNPKVLTPADWQGKGRRAGVP